MRMSQLTKTIAATASLVFLIGVTSAQTLRLDPSGAFFTERDDDTESGTAARTTVGDISNTAFSR